jgi:AcrR family transcriptional regulator
LFAHFRSKEAVQIELLNYMSEFAAECVIRPSRLAAEGLPQLLALVRNWLGWAQRAGLPGGCPVAAGLFEFDDVEGAVRSKILEMVVRRHVGSAGAAGGRTRTSAQRSGRRAVRLGAVRHLPEPSRGAPVSSLADADQRAQTAFDALLARALPPRGKRASAIEHHRAKPKSKARKHQQ